MQNAFSTFAIVGNGRLAQHLRAYISQLNLPFTTWSRAENSTQSLASASQSASHVLLAVKDSAIEELAALTHPNQTVVHFSGAHTSKRASAAHPLMTFGAQIQSTAFYERIPFILDSNYTLAQLLPGLKNPYRNLAPEDRAYYHALCALAGNATHLLWQRIGAAFEKDLDLPRTLLTPYLTQVAKNSAEDKPENFTGPVARGDWSTVRTHLAQLERQPDLLDSYRQYLKLARESGYPPPESLL